MTFIRSLFSCGFCSFWQLSTTQQYDLTFVLYSGWSFLHVEVLPKRASNSSLYCSPVCTVQPRQAPLPELCTHQTTIPETCGEECEAVCGEGHSLGSTRVAWVTLQLSDFLLQMHQKKIKQTSTNREIAQETKRVYRGISLSDVKQSILAHRGQP